MQSGAGMISTEMAVALIGAAAAAIGIVVALFNSARAYGRLEAKVDGLVDVAKQAAIVPVLENRITALEKYCARSTRSRPSLHDEEALG